MPKTKLDRSKAKGILLEFVCMALCLNVQIYNIKLVTVVTIGMYDYIQV